MEKYFLYQEYGNENNAGPKAKKDINQILSNLDFKGIEFEIPANKYLRPVLSRITWKKKLSRISNSLIVCQYPFYSHIFENSLTKEIKHQKYKKNNIFVAFIHDIETLRREPNNLKKINLELSVLNSFDYLVCHNSNMKRWLLKNGINSQILVLDLFDYLASSQPVEQKIDKEFRVLNYAGNLSKSIFLKNAFTKLPVNIFGPNYSSEYNLKNYQYKGEFTPEEIPRHINNGFGLIWDGNSIQEPENSFGNYLKYITPHKFSLYLRSGVPVIAWSKSAISKFIVENKIGVVLDDLTDVDNELAKITLPEYKQMKNNCYNFSRKLQEGFYTQRVITEIEQYCENNGKLK